MGETRPDFSKVGNRVYTTMPLLPRVCLSVIGQDRSYDLKVWQYRLFLLKIKGRGRGGRCHTISSLKEYKSYISLEDTHKKGHSQVPKCKRLIIVKAYQSFILFFFVLYGSVILVRSRSRF